MLRDLCSSLEVTQNHWAWAGIVGLLIMPGRKRGERSKTETQKARMQK